MYPESLGQHATQLDFNLVDINIVEGRYLPDENQCANAFKSAGTFFHNVREQMFDHTEQDEEMLAEIEKEILRARAGTTARNVLESALEDIKRASTVLDFIAGRIDALPQKSRLEELLDNQPQEQEIVWRLSDEGKEITLHDFVDEMVPYLKTGEWLKRRSQQFEETGSVNFIETVQITSRPALIVS